MCKSTVVITGASGSFGIALTQRLLEAGNRVVGITRREESIVKLENSIAVEYRDNFIGLNQDLVEEDSVHLLLEKLAKLSITPTGLVNNARSLDFLKVEANGVVSRAHFINEYLLDVVVPYELSVLLAEKSTAKLTSIVNVGSMYGTVAVNPNLYIGTGGDGAPIHYGVSKAALSHLSKELAVRLADRGVRVNCVAFGGKEGRVGEQFLANYKSMCPSARMLSDSDITGPIEFLLSEQSSAVTGHTLMADGGWVAW